MNKELGIRNKGRGKIFVLLLSSAVVVALGFYLYSSLLIPSSQNSAEQEFVLSPMGEEYRNEQYGFSLRLPQGFTAREVEDSIVLEDQTGNGIQIIITPLDEDIPTLTKNRIQQDIPDMQISDEQVVEVGASRKGLAFRSDNEAFGGASREVWFVFRGNLYQISTYERLDPLLKAVFQTWQFF